MAASLDEEVKRKRAAAALLDNGDDGSGDDTEADLSTDLPEDVLSTSEAEPSQPSRPIYAPATKKGPSYVLVPLDQTGKAAAAPDTSGHIDLAPPKPPEATTYPTIAEDQPGAATAPAPEAGKAFTPTSYDTSVDLFGENEKRYVTDPESGARYAVDPDTGAKIPRAEIATEADKQAFKPSDVTLPQVNVAGNVPVRRAELVDPDPDAQYFDTTPPPVQPAPDKLTQVERGQLVSTPPGTAPKAIGRAAPVTYPTIAEDQGAPGTPPAVQPAQPVTPTAPKPRASQFGLTLDEYNAQYGPGAKPNVPGGTISTTTTTGAPPDASGLNINTDYTAQSGSYAKGRAGDGKIQGIILHSSDGTEKSGISQLTTGGVSAHYFVTKDGRIYQFVNDQDTAYHAGKTKGPYAGYNNNNTIGIEQEHYDPGSDAPAEFRKNGETWSSAQVAATAKLVAYLKNKYGLTDNQIMGHSDVAPGRKQDPYNYPWESFFSSVDKQGGAATTTTTTGATTATTGKTVAGGTEGYISGKATTFGYKDPDDSGVGAPKLGGLSTNNTDLIGIAVPEAALRSYVSAHPADWRKARVDVVGKNGQHVLVPIVDLGPRDTSGAVAADFTQGLTNLTGNTGDQNYQFKIIPNAGPDVMKNPQEFADEQAAIRAGIDTGAKIRPQAPVAKKPSYVLKPMDPAMSVAADTANQYAQQGQMDTLRQLSDSSQNVVGLYKQLDKPVEGVSDAVRQQFQANLKPQIIGLMKQKYPDLSDADAWAKAQTDVNALDVGTDFWDKFVGSFQQLSPLLQQATGVQAEQSHVNAFLDSVLPKGSNANKNALLTKLYAMPADQRGAYVSSLIPNPQTGVPGQDPQEVVSALERLSDPNYAKQQAAQMDAAKAALNQRMTTDPRLVGTPAAFASENLAQIPEMIAAAGIPPLMAAQIGQQLREQMKAEHPEYGEDELDQKAAYGTLVQLVGQEAAGRLFGAGTGALMQGIKSPIKKAIAQALTQTSLGAGISGGTQALTNVVTGEPIGQGVAAATVGGALQGGVTGAVHAGAEALHPEATTKAPLGEEPAVPPPATGPKGGAVRGAESETMATGGQPSVDQPRPEEVTPQEPAQPSAVPVDQLGQVQQPAASAPPYIEAHSGNMRPLGYRAAVRLSNGELFIGSDHESALKNAQENGSIRVTDENTEFGFRGKDGNFVSMNDADRILQQKAQQASPIRAPLSPIPKMPPTAEPTAPIPVTQEAVSRRAYELYDERTKSGQPGTIADDYTRAQKELSQATEPPPATVSEAEPINSAIANRYVQERMASGELGQIDPSQGKSTEDMVQQGLQMSRDQREGLIKNFMKGTGGDLDQQGAAIRAREAILSEQARSASRAADADPTNLELQSQAKAASNAVTAFHNGPIKKFKRVWSDAGRGLQREIPLDYTTLNGMKEAYLKGKGNGNEAPSELEPKLKKMADVVSKTADRERTAMNNLGKEIEKQTRGKPLPNDDQIRGRLMEIMGDLPCRT